MLRFYIPNMTCGGCARIVTRALLSVDPQARIETDPAAREVRVVSALEEGAFLAVLSESGIRTSTDRHRLAIIQRLRLAISARLSMIS